jgi:methylenetetrahydrofolate--tRNA-(uracil-5-)-methyltransferase
MSLVRVIGGGLAGCEAAWRLARSGHAVELVEMRPQRKTPAHRTDALAELVCTNSFKSVDPTNAHGLLKTEMRALGSILLAAADESRVPAGTALAVDRELFAAAMTRRIQAEPSIRVVRREATGIPEGPTVLATGPLTSDALSAAIVSLLGDAGLAFYDSIAPIVSHDSIDLGVAFYGSRWGKGDGADYLNCPLDRERYVTLIDAIREADTYPGHDWENVPFFEGCLPVEEMVRRGEDTLRFGPMKPVGLSDPRTGGRAYAVVQLRREDRAGQMWNMVGFQTRLRTGEQRRVFRLIPGLEEAEFLRTGSIHRNTYLNFPERLTAYGAPHARPDVIVAGQLTGVEGYTESAASGILAGINMDRLLRGVSPSVPPASTMIGALYRFLAEASPKEFQPMNSNLGLLAPLAENIPARKARRARLAERARGELADWMREARIERYAPGPPGRGGARPAAAEPAPVVG